MRYYMTFVFLYDLTHSKTINYIKISFNQLLSFNQPITSFKISFDQLFNSFKISFNQLLSYLITWKIKV